MVLFSLLLKAGFWSSWRKHMLAYVREISRTGGWVAESLKHLSFLLASPCGAQIGYFSTPRPLRKHLGFQHLTQSQEHGPGEIHVFQGRCPSSPAECAQPTWGSSEGRNQWTTSSLGKQSLVLDIFKLLPVPSPGKMHQSDALGEASGFNSSANWWPSASKMAAELLHVNKRLESPFHV